MTEKMVAAAWAAGNLKYPADELDAAARDMATSQFHDILPGSSITAVYDDADRDMTRVRELCETVTGAAARSWSDSADTTTLDRPSSTWRGPANAI